MSSRLRDTAKPANRRRRTALALIAAALATAALSALAALRWTDATARYVTWDGIGPDKWGSIWLVRRHVDPDAVIELRAPKSPVDGAVAFDVPGARLSRDAALTAFEKIQDAYAVSDPAVSALASILNQIEIGGWQVPAFSDAAQVEAAYRQLQHRFGRANVPFGCYLAFFDRVHAVIAAGETPLAHMAPEQLVPDVDCDLSTELPDARDALVPELDARAVLGRIASGRKVVFVDTREDDEFAAGHIPGAVQLKLREVAEDSIAAFADADLVVPYCVKDFRGYEVARALHKLGVPRVAIMSPYGIRGWKQLGLPVTDGLADGGASQRLEACVGDVDKCLGTL